MLLATMREKPRSRASCCDVDLVAGAGNRAGSERQRVGLGARAAEPVVIAPQRGDVRQEEMRDENRLRRPEVRERGHQRVAGVRRLARERGDTGRHAALQQRDAPSQIEPEIDRDLLVARSAGVETPPGVAEPLDEQPLDEAMDVFVGAVDEGRIRSSAIQDVGERRFDLARFVARDDAGVRQRARPRGAPLHVVLEEASIEAKRGAELEGRLRPARRRSAPTTEWASFDPYPTICEYELAASPTREPFQTPGQRGGAAGVARNDENRVVAADRADRFGQLRPIDGDRQRLGLSDAGADDDELLHVVDVAEELADGALERGERRFGTGGVEPRPLIGAVAGALHQPELLDVARDRRLGGVEAALVQAAPQLFLAAQRVAIDELEDDGLAARFH